MEVKKNTNSTKIQMELFNGEKIKTPLLLLKALELIDDLPTSVELKENYISFENQINQYIKFHRLFYDLWTLELKFFGYTGKKLNLSYKYIRTRTVKAIVIHFFCGIFIGTLNLCEKSLRTNESRNLKLRKVIALIEAKLQKHSLCKFCGMKLPYNLKEKCEFCGLELNFKEILLI
ncbi:MAG: hypothetical protein ACFE96_10880 [Candidatus Hermodarchaeota archaeon]